jgi:hypothetical protein
VRDSGRFTYHLEKLVGPYVERTDGGYRLRRPGAAAVNAIQSGALTEARTRDPVDLDDDCLFCGRPLVFRYGDNVGEVVCDACERVHVQHCFPPGGVADRPAAAVPAAFDRYARASLGLAADGVCPECAGPVQSDVVTDLEGCLDAHPVGVGLDCARCEFRVLATAGELLAQDPTAAARLAEGGLDVDDGPLWTVRFAVDGESTTLESRDPWRIVVRVPVDGTVHEVVLDGSPSVVAVRPGAESDG